MNIKPVISISVNNIQKQIAASTQQEMLSPKPTKTFRSVAYTTADGGLFVGYYLNTRG